MGFLDVFKGKFNDLSTKVKQYKNKDMLEAIVAGCALVAYADGVVDTAEKAKMMGFIQNSPELSVFGMSDVVKSFDNFMAGFGFDLTVGKAQALNAMAKLKSKPEEARIAVAVAISVGGADGNFDDSEKAVVKEICAVVGIAPEEFGL